MACLLFRIATASPSRHPSVRVFELSHPRKRAREMPGAVCARSLACKSRKHASKSPRSHRLSRHSPRRWCYGFLRALPGDRALLPPSSAQCASIVANLISASGYQDHTTSPSAGGITRQLMRPRPSHPAPTFVTIAKRPSAARDGRIHKSDLPVVTSERACGTLARRANQLCGASTGVKGDRRPDPQI
jgi:hypothetical protein